MLDTRLTEKGGSVRHDADARDRGSAEGTGLLLTVVSPAICGTTRNGEPAPAHVSEEPAGANTQGTAHCATGGKSRVKQGPG